MLVREAPSWKTIGVTIHFQLKNIGWRREKLI
jgi:hypothetical protein